MNEYPLSNSVRAKVLRQNAISLKSARLDSGPADPDADVEDDERESRNPMVIPSRPTCQAKRSAWRSVKQDRQRNDGHPNDRGKELDQEPIDGVDTVGAEQLSDVSSNHSGSHQGGRGIVL
jgi:hypothetical protein